MADLTPDQQEAIQRAIDAIKAQAGQPMPSASEPLPVSPLPVAPQAPNDEQTMQVNPGALLDTLKRKKEQEMLDNLFKNQ